MTHLINLDNCVRYDAGTFIGYVIGIVPSSENHHEKPKELRYYNDITESLDDDDRINIREKRRIVEEFGGRIDRFAIVSCEMYGYRYMRYIYIVGEFPAMFTDDVITDLIHLVGSGYPFMVKYNEVPPDALSIIGQYFHIVLNDNEVFTIAAVRDTWWSMCIRSIVWPYFLLRRLWCQIFDDE